MHSKEIEIVANRITRHSQFWSNFKPWCSYKLGSYKKKKCIVWEDVVLSKIFLPHQIFLVSSALRNLGSHNLLTARLFNISRLAHSDTDLYPDTLFYFYKRHEPEMWLRKILAPKFKTFIDQHVIGVMCVLLVGILYVFSEWSMFVTDALTVQLVSF